MLTYAGKWQERLEVLLKHFDTETLARLARKMPKPTDCPHRTSTPSKHSTLNPNRSIDQQQQEEKEYGAESRSGVVAEQEKRLGLTHAHTHAAHTCSHIQHGLQSLRMALNPEASPLPSPPWTPLGTHQDLASRMESPALSCRTRLHTSSGRSPAALHTWAGRFFIRHIRLRTT